MVFWIALGILLIAVVAGIAYAAIRGWQLYRTAKSTGASITSEMDRISAVTLEIEQQMAKAEAATARLNAATGRLSTSRAQLDVQLAAVREARAQVRRVFWFVPGI
jgi:chromosome segregation ATPase